MDSNASREVGFFIILFIALVTNHFNYRLIHFSVLNRLVEISYPVVKFPIKTRNKFYVDGWFETEKDIKSKRRYRF